MAVPAIGFAVTLDTFNVDQPEDTSVSISSGVGPSIRSVNGDAFYIENPYLTAVGPNDPQVLSYSFNTPVDLSVYAFLRLEEVQTEGAPVITLDLVDSDGTNESVQFLPVTYVIGFSAFSEVDLHRISTLSFDFSGTEGYQFITTSVELVVPEPAALGLIAFGTLLLGWQILFRGKLYRK